MPDSSMGLSAIWHAGDRVEVHGPRQDGRRGRVAVLTDDVKSLLAERGWTGVVLDDEEGVYAFGDDELTRIDDA